MRGERMRKQKRGAGPDNSKHASDVSAVDYWATLNYLHQACMACSKSWCQTMALPSPFQNFMSSLEGMQFGMSSPHCITRRRTGSQRMQFNLSRSLWKRWIQQPNQDLHHQVPVSLAPYIVMQGETGRWAPLFPGTKPHSLLYVDIIDLNFLEVYKNIRSVTGWTWWSQHSQQQVIQWLFKISAPRILIQNGSQFRSSTFVVPSTICMLTDPMTSLFLERDSTNHMWWFNCSIQ